jgi:multidrug transporter EmrE-like cation transporter
MLLKKSGGVDWRYIVLGFIAYGLVAIPVAFAFRNTEFGKLFLVWEVLAVILGMIVASFYYKEHFTVYRAVALILALAALYFSYK